MGTRATCVVRAYCSRLGAEVNRDDSVSLITALVRCRVTSSEAGGTEAGRRCRGGRESNGLRRSRHSDWYPVYRGRSHACGQAERAALFMGDLCPASACTQRHRQGTRAMEVLSQRGWGSDRLPRDRLALGSRFNCAVGGERNPPLQ